MSGLPSAIVLDPDLRAARMLELGLAREGVSVSLPATEGALDLTAGGVIVVGDSLDLLRRARAAAPDAPILFTGAAARADAEAAGADEVIPRPTYLRDLVTVTRLLRDSQPSQRDHLIGSLADTTTTLALVRALSALGRSAVLTLIRGLRRGEVRFYKGEVTSAQVGLIHGQAALHQLLLWTDARFEFHREDLVRRQQIPLPPDELFADAERFLEGVRESAGALSPASILEQDMLRVQNLGKQIPTEVHGVLRMFDGHRVLADILEDSPYRVFETLRVAQKALEVGLLRIVENQRKKATWRAVLAIEEWLVGSETRDAVVERTAGLDSTTSVPKQRKRNKKRRAKTPLPVATPVQRPDIDWGALVPRIIGAEVGPLSGVVPAAAAHGEIEMRTREEPREGLEALMDTDKRQRIFPTEIGIEPSVVLGADAAAEPAAVPTVSSKPGETAPLTKIDLEEPDEWERAEWEAKERALAKERARALAETPPAGMEKVAARPAPVATASTEPAPARPAPVATASTAPARPASAAAATAAVATASTEPAPEETREAREARVNESVERMRLERVRREEADQAAAKLIALPSIPTPPAVTPAAAVAAAPDAAGPPRTRPKPGTDARDLVKQLVAEAVPQDAAPVVETPPERSVRARIHTPITVAETPAATISVADTVTVVAAADTAHVTASPTVVIREAPPVDHMVAMPIAQPTLAEPAPAPRAEPAPATAPQPAAAPRAEPAPPRTEPTPAPAPQPAAAPRAEPTPPRAEPTPAAAPVADAPSILAGELTPGPAHVPAEPAADAPSILVADLAAVHAAASRASAASSVAAPPADAASASRELVVNEVRQDAAVAFTDLEEAFFKKNESGPVRQVKVESFDDLDEGYEPPKFWDRVFGRKKPPKR